MKNKENLEHLIEYLKMVQGEIQMAIDGKKPLSKVARVIGITSQEMNYFKNKPEYFDTLLRKNFMSNTEFLEVIKNNQSIEELLVKAAFRIDEDKIISLLDDEIEKVNNTINNDLQPREKEVIYMRFYDKLTYEQIATQLGKTRERARQIEVKSIRKLRRKLYWFFKEKYAKKTFTIDDLIDFTEIRESRIERIIRLTIDVEKIIRLDDFQAVRAGKYFRDNNLENSTEEDIIKYFKEHLEEFSNFLSVIYLETDLEKIYYKKPTPIEYHEWSTRAYTCLKKEGIDTFEDFNYYSLRELRNIKNLGKKSFNEIITNIKIFNENKPPREKINIGGL